MTTKEQAARYRALVLEVDKARGAYAIANMEYLKERTKASAAASNSSMDDLDRAQEALEEYVTEHGIPKLEQRY